MKGFDLLLSHRGVAAYAALLFSAGFVTAWPVTRLNLALLVRIPLAVLRFVARLIGPEPSLPRLALVIFLFNSTAMFVYMSTGFVPGLPWVIALWTGLNIGIVCIKTPELEPPFANRPPDEHSDGPASRAEMLLVGACFLLVLLIELPCFWLSVAMGVTLSNVPFGAERVELWTIRAAVYVRLIVPALLISAIAESKAVLGAGGWPVPPSNSE